MPRSGSSPRTMQAHLGAYDKRLKRKDRTMGKKKDYISPKEAEKITGLSKSTIRRLCRDQIIKCKEDGRNWLIEKKSLHEAAAAGLLPSPRRRWGKDHQPPPPDGSRYVSEKGVTVEEAYQRAIKAQFLLDGLDEEQAQEKLDFIERSVSMIMG
jgi:excisionase family DNA binding protein